jgi:hypothetical protein
MSRSGRLVPGISLGIPVAGLAAFRVVILRMDFFGKTTLVLVFHTELSITAPPARRGPCGGPPGGDTE